ncbi:hypothetical protein BDR06DRAFT_971619 [Suillus hirtellus]|nr:hypothetical protein BDR06DRAFT_971619 [Suillus hirtellus]
MVSDLNFRDFTLQLTQVHIMPNALTLFKVNTTLPDTWLQAFDAHAIAMQRNLVIMTSNMHFIPEFCHFDKEILQACTDGRFGIIDCFQWPQAYDNTFCYAACIPQKEAFPSSHPLHWAWFTPTQNDLESIPGNSFPVDTLALDKVEGLQSLFKLAEQQLYEYRQAQPDRGQLNLSQLQAFVMLFRAIEWALLCRVVMSVRNYFVLVSPFDMFVQDLVMARHHLDRRVSQSTSHTPLKLGYRFPEHALLIGLKLPERLQIHLANWLASHMLVPSTQPQSHQEKAPDRKGLMATKKQKQVMWELFGNDLLESQGDIFLPDVVVKFQGEDIPISSLTNPSALLAQKVTWELSQRQWKEDPAGHKQLLHSIFLGDAGLVM